MKIVKKIISSLLLSIALISSGFQVSTNAIDLSYEMYDSRTQMDQFNEISEFISQKIRQIKNILMHNNFLYEAIKHTFIRNDKNPCLDISQFEFINYNLKAAWDRANKYSTIANWKYVITLFDQAFQNNDCLSSILSTNKIRNLYSWKKAHLISANYSKACAYLAFEYANKTNLANDWHKAAYLLETAAQAYQREQMNKEYLECSRKAAIAYSKVTKASLGLEELI